MRSSRGAVYQYYPIFYQSLGVVLIVTFILCGCATAPRYSALPYFSPEQFARVSPDMSEDEVRDLIGPPVYRYPSKLKSDETMWQYTRTGKTGKPWDEYLVAFDARRNVQRRLTQTRASGNTNPFWMVSPKRTPKLELTLISGERVRLDTYWDGLLLVNSYYSKPAAWLALKERLTVLTENEAAAFHVLLVCVNENLEGVEQFVINTPFEVQVAHDPEGRILKTMKSTGKYHRLFLLEGGEVVPFNDVAYEHYRDAYLDDLVWLIRSRLRTR